MPSKAIVKSRELSGGNMREQKFYKSRIKRAKSKISAPEEEEINCKRKVGFKSKFLPNDNKMCIGLTTSSKLSLEHNYQMPSKSPSLFYKRYLKF